MPKILKRKTTSRTIALYNDQLDKIALLADGTGSSLVEFVRTAVDNEIKRLQGEDSGTPFGLNNLDDKSFLIPADIYKELFDIKDSAFARRKSSGKINVRLVGGRQYVEIANQHEASLMAQFLTFQSKTTENISVIKELVNEYLERMEGIESVVSVIRTNLEETQKV